MNSDAEIMVVGQAPGNDEIIKAEPFVGTSGKFFEEAIKEVCGLDRSDLYFTNVVKCMMLDRKPYRSEIENCQSYLDKEIALVRPKFIVTLGSLAFKQITGMSGIMKHQGEMHYSVKYKADVLALLHPSPYNMNNPERREMFYKGLEALNTRLKGDKVAACG
jgi:DNA polymerase